MTVLSQLIEIYPGFDIMLEALLIGFVIALVGAGGYVFFVYSMKDDHADRIREKYMNNPWDNLSGREEKKSPKNQPSRKIKTVLLSLMAILVVLIILILAIKFGWIKI